MTPEGKVKKFVDKFVAEHFPNAWRYNPPGGAFGKAGTPDKLILFKGVMIAIETKAGTPVTKLQAKNLKHLRDQGCIAAVVDGEDIDKMRLILEAVKKELNNRGLSYDN